MGIYMGVSVEMLESSREFSAETWTGLKVLSLTYSHSATVEVRSLAVAYSTSKGILSTLVPIIVSLLAPLFPLN